MRRVEQRVTGALVLALLCGSRLLAQSPGVDPYSLATVKAACGPEGASARSFAKSAAAPALEPGKARVYVITESWKFSGFAGEPVLLGMDGRWFGANRSRHFGFSFRGCRAGHTSSLRCGERTRRVAARAGRGCVGPRGCGRGPHVLLLQ